MASLDLKWVPRPLGCNVRLGVADGSREEERGRKMRGGGRRGDSPRRQIPAEINGDGAEGEAVTGGGFRR